MPTPEMYFDYAETFYLLEARGSMVMPPVKAGLTPDVIQGGLLTAEISGTLITNEAATNRFCMECSASADECRRRGVACAELREQWRQYRTAMVAYAAAAQAAAAMKPPGTVPPPPVAPPTPPSWCQF
ncbi:MAG: hypothetical protein JWL70_178 [Acidimicrobiia bacterium]|nr:hypothetical protein [Acidimicrobiia bacterium]